MTVSFLSRGRLEGQSIGLIWCGYNWSLKKTSKAAQRLRPNLVTLLIDKGGTEGWKRFCSELIERKKAD